MRVVHVFKDYHPPTYGGIEQHMQVLCTGLASRMEVGVLVPSRSRSGVTESLGGVSVIRVPEFGRYAAVPFCPTMAAQLRALRPDIVHLHFPNPMGDAAYLVGARSARLVVSYHADVVRQRALLPWYRPLRDWTLRKATRIIAASAEYVASSGPLLPHRDKCIVVPYGVELDAFALRDGDSDRARELRRRHEDGLVLFVGVLRPYKGLDVLLTALTMAGGHLIVAGAGPERTRLEGLEKSLGLSGRVTFVGAVSDAERRVLLHACDVLVLPSTDRREAFGIAQLEAMACSKPVVVSDLGTGMRAVTQHGETGILVPPRDAAALASAINRLLNDQPLRLRLGRAGRERVEREFNAAGMVARTCEVYAEALGPSAQRGR